MVGDYVYEGQRYSLVTVDLATGGDPCVGCAFQEGTLVTDGCISAGDACMARIEGKTRIWKPKED